MIFKSNVEIQSNFEFSRTDFWKIPRTKMCLTRSKKVFSTVLWVSSCKFCPGPRRDTVGAYLPYPQFTSEFNKKQKKSFFNKENQKEKVSSFFNFARQKNVFEIFEKKDQFN